VFNRPFGRPLASSTGPSGCSIAEPGADDGDGDAGDGDGDLRGGLGTTD